jgi:uncharacterized protein (DUF1330 family)
MKGYVIVNVEVTDPKLYPDYIKIAPESIAIYGGRYLVRGGRAEKLEGSWEPHRFVILEFETYEQARRWWESEEYREPKALRQRTARTNMILVEGLERPFP